MDDDFDLYLNKVGSEVSVAQSIGAREEDDACAFASHNLTIALMISVCWGFLLFVLANPIISFFKLDTEISGTAVSYLKIVATGFPFISWQPPVPEFIMRLD